MAKEQPVFSTYSKPVELKQQNLPSLSNFSQPLAFQELINNKLQ